MRWDVSFQEFRLIVYKRSIHMMKPRKLLWYCYHIYFSSSPGHVNRIYWKWKPHLFGLMGLKNNFSKRCVWFYRGIRTCFEPLWDFTHRRRFSRCTQERCSISRKDCFLHSARKASWNLTQTMRIFTKTLTVLFVRLWFIQWSAVRREHFRQHHGKFRCALCWKELIALCFG